MRSKVETYICGEKLPFGFSNILLNGFVCSSLDCLWRFEVRSNQPERKIWFWLAGNDVRFFSEDEFIRMAKLRSFE